jgi:branched-subunit amino acid transport protein AzlD
LKKDNGEKAMLNTLQMLITIAVIALATFATRALPFICFGSRQPPAILSVIEKNLPPMILLLLVIYCLKDVQWLSAPYGIPELFTIGIVAGLHIWKRNAMLSIFTGTALYMILVQLNVFSFL